MVIWTYRKGKRPKTQEVNHMTTLNLNQIVRNFGTLAKVVGFHEITGDPILQELYNKGERWLAAADKCEPVLETETASYRHADGLITLG
jgi:hypothetical protein